MVKITDQPPRGIQSRHLWKLGSLSLGLLVYITHIPCRVKGGVELKNMREQFRGLLRKEENMDPIMFLWCH